MPITVTMPQLGESVVEGVIARWLKREGDAIARDEPFVEIMTDKVNVELPAIAAGTLVRILAAEGATVLTVNLRKIGTASLNTSNRLP